MLRRMLISGIGGFLALSAAQPVRAELWCIRDFGSSQRTCVFPSGQDCFRAVRVRGGIRDARPLDEPKTEGRRSRQPGLSGGQPD